MSNYIIYIYHIKISTKRAMTNYIIWRDWSNWILICSNSWVVTGAGDINHGWLRWSWRRSWDMHLMKNSLSWWVPQRGCSLSLTGPAPTTAYLSRTTLPGVGNVIPKSFSFISVRSVIIIYSPFFPAHMLSEVCCQVLRRLGKYNWSTHTYGGR